MLKRTNDGKYGISKSGMDVMNTLMNDTFDKIVREAGFLVTYTKTRTMSARCIRTATKLHYSGELGAEACVNADHALKKFNDSRK